MEQGARQAIPAADEASGRLKAVAPSYPVVIIGGGINGCGLFRDLSAQGIDCLLVEAKDFCSGASAAPSRLIHGGIKYLETGEFRLVRQSALERNRLLKNAPHYVKPLETVLPVYSWFGGIIPSIRRFFRLKAKLNDRGAVITRIGLLLYDLFGRHVRTMPNHRMLGRRRALALMPDLTPRIAAAGIYYEGRITHAERLGLELILDGERDNPASRALNHVAVIASGEGSIVIRDEIDGTQATVSTGIVINAGGAWIDKVNAALGIPTAYMGGNKGSHLIVRNDRLHEALRGRMIYFGSADGRVNLLYPFMGNVLIGSTDIPVSDPDTAECDDRERDYLADITREVFPDIAVRPEEVVMTYCGVRPLPASEGLDPGAVSRDHSIATDTLPDGRTPVHSLIGGKWTTFRGFSEEAADLVLKALGKKRLRSTENLPIGGGRDFPAGEAGVQAAVAALARQADITDERAGILYRRYGTRCRFYLDGRAAGASETGIADLPDYSAGEIAWLCRNESVGRLEDLVFRRTDMALSGRLTRAALLDVAEIAAEALHWSPERKQAEIRHALAVCTGKHIRI